MFLLLLLERNTVDKKSSFRSLVSNLMMLLPVLSCYRRWKLHWENERGIKDRYDIPALERRKCAKVARILHIEGKLILISFEIVFFTGSVGSISNQLNVEACPNFAHQSLRNFWCPKNAENSLQSHPSMEFFLLHASCISVVEGVFPIITKGRKPILATLQLGAA